MQNYKLIYLLLLFATCYSCQQSKAPKQVDMILHNGRVYTVDSLFSIQEAVAIKDGKVIMAGTDQDITKLFVADTSIDMKGKFLYPGFIDAHCHFYGYGKNQSQLNLKEVKSLNELEQQVVKYASDLKEGWIIGRGWNEENWTDTKEVHNKGLNKLFPDRPVILQRIDGHSLLANKAAIQHFGLDINSVFEGGELRKKDGQLTGVLVDNAANYMLDRLPEISNEEIRKALLAAQNKCLSEGLTSVADAGLDLEILQQMDLLSGNELQIRIYAMANPWPEEFSYFRENGKIDKPAFKVQSFKLYGDGSLGSKSAWLKKSYCGEPGNFGLPQKSTAYFDSICRVVHEMGFQLNTHCIGDSANATFLKLYGKYTGTDNPNRWRIEHAQVVEPQDMQYFGKYQIIPSVQPTHAISDMYMAKDRLCNDLRGAYAYKSLLEQLGMIAFGTDFPVENVSPIATFYTATQRKNEKGESFEAQEAIEPQDALRAMTIWAAYACFMEDEVGSIEPKKNADFVLLDTDLLKEFDHENVQVLATFVGGKQVYANP